MKWNEKHFSLLGKCSALDLKSKLAKMWQTQPLNIFPKNKPNKKGQMKMDQIKEEIHLNYTTIIKYISVFLSVYFSSDKLAKQT